MTYKYSSAPEQPAIIDHHGRYRELPHTSPSTNNSITRETVAKMEPDEGMVYALAAIADNLAALTDMLGLRGEEQRTELAQLAQNTLRTNADHEGRN
ncbi:hypothetical protein [Bifidobacterium moukalabense]|uniref:hypothetical protein n=1 Tax=Bifidobacterium moukalabense TaxID=1333651 RepID=UPI0010F8EAE8|nr:hypothetical protein [Bifidobacterium moukalabense]